MAGTELRRKVERMIIENRADGAGYIDASDQSSLADDIIALIAKEREQAAAEARIDELERIDAANKDNGINFWFKDLKIEGSLENNNGWRTISQYVPERLAKLQSTQSVGLKRLGEENQMTNYNERVNKVEHDQD